MMGVKHIIDRIPRFALFAAAALIQVALIALMVIDRVAILRSGTEVTLPTRPVDPRDFLRGDYVVLAYDISRIPVGEARNGTTVFVKLAPDADGVHRLVSVHADPAAVTAPEVMIRGRVTAYNGVHYGIESYFVPEGEGRAIEMARNQGKVTVVAAVTPAGRAAIKRLLIDGKPVYDEPWF